MPRPDMSAERIPQILQAAMEVFARDGLASARMEDIAKRAGISKATVYLYFKTKEDLVSALLDAFLEEALAELQASSEAGGSPASALMNWSSKTTARLTATKAYANLGLEFMALAARHAATKAALATYYEAYTDAVEDLIASGVASGEFRQVNSAEAAKSLVALLEGLHLLWLVSDGKVDIETDTRTALTGYLQSLSA
ncbi:TetR/AcrR family transcriptional regulator [Roseibium sp.]|uniref:TetR/AcrR family transcriptional regulator n=1 Tax=Roseibium sp. TaxID=1936156 RepID=UPI003D09731D